MPSPRLVHIDDRDRNLGGCFQQCVVCDCLVPAVLFWFSAHRTLAHDVTRAICAVVRVTQRYPVGVTKCAVGVYEHALVVAPMKCLRLTIKMALLGVCVVACKGSMEVHLQCIQTVLLSQLRVLMAQI